MKTRFAKMTSGLLLVALMSCEDPEGLVSEQLVQVQFQNETLTISENSTAGALVVLTLIRNTTEAGTIRLTVAEGEYNRIQTNPVHVDGILSLPVAKGVNQLQFNVKPIDNALMEGDQTLLISIDESSGFLLGEQKTFELVIEDDDTDGEPEPVLSTASFIEQSETVKENEGAVTYKIVLSPVVSVDSKVIVEMNTNNSSTFVTQPASTNGRITLEAPAGSAELSFTVEAINNTVLTGHTEIEFSLVSTEGSVVLGQRVLQKVTISDDELAGRLKTYTIHAGESGEKRTYEYDATGRIARVVTVRNAPHNTTTLTDTYFYDAQDRVVKRNLWLGRDVVYTWENNRIERADVYQDGVLIQYANYAYDDAGNVGGVEPFYKQKDGSFKRGLFNIYLYFTNGNIYKALTYQDSPNSEEPVLVSTQTYDQYMDVNAPIAMFEILPTVKAQVNLAGAYRYEQHLINSDLSYTITYEFSPDGLPLKRTASAPGDTQVVLYDYY